MGEATNVFGYYLRRDIAGLCDISYLLFLLVVLLSCRFVKMD